MPEAKPDQRSVRADPGQGYAGDVSVDEAWRVLTEDPAATLVDVRTMAEWAYVGNADLSTLGKRPLLIEWQSFPDRTTNPDFSAQVAGAVADKDQTLLFLCRSGARSAVAAAVMAARGYTRCYNVSDGFEGDPDANRHRGTAGGWKAAGLPWVQS